MPRLFVSACATLLLLTLASCGTTTDSSGPLEPKVVDSFCSIARPIFWADGDTDATILAVKQHNAVGKDRCGW